MPPLGAVVVIVVDGGVVELADAASEAAVCVSHLWRLPFLALCQDFAREKIYIYIREKARFLLLSLVGRLLPVEMIRARDVRRRCAVEGALLYRDAGWTRVGGRGTPGPTVSIWSKRRSICACASSSASSVKSKSSAVTRPAIMSSPSSSSSSSSGHKAAARDMASKSAANAESSLGAWFQSGKRCYSRAHQSSHRSSLSLSLKVFSSPRGQREACSLDDAP